jgi:ferredoxin--NADP+ reductase
MGAALPGVPFDEKSGTIPNEKGRVVDPAARAPRPGEYATGWIKRGPSGVIGTNKPDSVETVQSMLDDLGTGSVLTPPEPAAAAVEALVRKRQPHYFSFPDWKRLDEIEVSRGKERNRPRVKFTSREEMRAALGR